MLLGLGVEYSIFLFSRFDQERRKNETNESIKIALSTTGASTLSSGFTTIIGFAVLTLSIFPMLGDMGFSLALGISIILAAIMLTSPIAIIIEEKLSKHKQKKKDYISEVEKFFEKYGRILSKRPWLFIIVPLIVTGIFFYGSNFIENKNIDFNNVLPKEMPELVSYNLINNELGQTSSVNIYIELDPSYTDSDEPIDIRDPRIINYVDVLTQKTSVISNYVSVNSISKIEKDYNNGLIPPTYDEQKKLLDSLDASNYISRDYTATIIRINLNEDSSNHDEEIVQELKKIIDETNPPAGLNVVPSGGLILDYEFNKILEPDSSKTAMYAFIMIIVLLLVLTRSVKYTIIPLLTVVLAIIWTLGLIGLLKIPFNAITSSVLSMTIGVGIDFGLQISMRYVLERKTKNKREAMRDTLKYTFYPLLITLIAALIGFRAMTLGQLKIMRDLGNTISLGMIASMVVAITFVSALIVILDRKEIGRAHV
jgi:hypothetical protein